jgi:hypothetical protein
MPLLSRETRSPICNTFVLYICKLIHMNTTGAFDPISFYMVSEPEFSNLENPFASASESSMASPAHSSSSSSSDEEQVLPPAPAAVVQTINIRSHVPVVLDLAELNYS